MKLFAVYKPQQVRTCGIQINIDPMIKMSSPTMAGKAGRKYTEPIINDKFPNRDKNVLNDPILFRGLKAVKAGSTIPLKISQTK